MNKIKIAMIILAVGVLSACTPNTTEETSSYVLPEGLKDCKVFVMQANGLSRITVVRCPNSQTAVKTSGKYPVQSIVTE